MKKKLFEYEFSVGGVKLADRAVFAKNLSVMLKSGITITESLDVSAASSKGKLKQIIRSVLRAVRRGRSLASAFEEYPKVFSGLFVNSVRAGEESGTLVENLEHVALQLEKEKELVDKIKGALLYPIILFISTLALGLAIAFLVLPKVTPLFTGLRVELPFTTRMLISFSELVQNHGFILIASIVGSIIFLFWFLKLKAVHPMTHWLLLRLPIIKNIVKGANIARFSRTLGTLLRSGIQIGAALDITRESLGNYYFSRSIGETAHRVSTGQKLSDGFGAYPQLYPVIVTRMIHVGEQSGNLDETLLYIANYYEKEVDVSTKSLSTALEPILLLIIGLVVGGLALSIITPIYEITGNIQR